MFTLRFDISHRNCNRGKCRHELPFATNLCNTSCPFIRALCVLYINLSTLFGITLWQVTDASYSTKNERARRPYAGCRRNSNAAKNVNSQRP